MVSLITQFILSLQANFGFPMIQTVGCCKAVLGLNTNTFIFDDKTMILCSILLILVIFAGYCSIIVDKLFCCKDERGI